MSEQPKWPPAPWGYNLHVGFYWVKHPENLPARLDLSDPVVRSVIIAAPGLYATLFEMREVLRECADDTVGTPTYAFFESKVQACDVILAKARGETAQTSPDRVGTSVEPPDVK